MSGLARVLLELLEVGAQERIEESDKECDEHNACSAEKAPDLVVVSFVVRPVRSLMAW